MKTQNTPLEITIPFDTIEDNGLILVHDIGEDLRNFLHSVCVKHTDTEAIKYLQNACYIENIGFKRNQDQWWEYIKAYPLLIADWS